MTLTMYDSIEVSTVPDNPQAVAGYTGGSWPTYNALVAKFPKAHHLSIAVTSAADADCLDCEPGDATVADVPGWVKRALARGVKRPVVYTSLSNAQAVLGALSAAGIKRSQIRLWLAHYTNVPHICGPHCGFGLSTTADATQYTEHALNRNLDASLVSDTFFAPAPPPPDPNHYGRYAIGPFPSPYGILKERAVVIAYDKARPHWIRDRGELNRLRPQLTFLAHRVWTVAHDDPVGGKPSWAKFDRGWRYQQLLKRSRGARVA